METFDRPLSDFRCAPMEKRKYLAMRGTRISLWLTKIRTRRQFGEGFILERTVLKKIRPFGFSVSIFFMSCPIGK